VFIKNMLFLCCLPVLLTIVMPINCNMFNSKINQSRYKRFPRQVNANNDQQICANDTVLMEKKINFTVQSSFDALNQSVKDEVHHMSIDRVIFPGRNNERRGRQLNSQGGNAYSYQDYMSQPWYAANKDYYDQYYANYYQSYYQTTTEPIRPQFQQVRTNQVSSQSNPQTLPNRVNNADAPNDDIGDSTIYIDENGLFQISKSNAINTVPKAVDDDAIVFQSDESQYDRTKFFDMNVKQSQMNVNGDLNSKIDSFDGLPVFSN